MIDLYDELVARQRRQAVLQWFVAILAWTWPGLAMAIGILIAVVLP